MFKRAIFALLVAGLMLGTVGCEAEVSPSGANGIDEPAAEVEAEKTEFALGEPINVDDAVMTVVSGKQFNPTNEFEEPSDGKVFYIVNIKIENGGTVPLDFNEFNYKIEDANGVQTGTAFVTDVPNPMNSGSLAPGGNLDANLVFEVPKDMKGLTLIMEPNFFSTQQVRIILSE